VQQVMDHPETSNWPAPAPFPNNTIGLSARAKNLHAWWAGFFAFAVPWCDMLLLAYQVQFTRPLVILAILAWLLSSEAGNRIRPMNSALYAMMLFIIVAPANFLWTEDPERTARRVVSYLGLFLMTLLFHQTSRSWQTHLFILKCLVAGCAVSVAGLAWNFARGVATGDDRYTAPGFDPNDLGAQLALSVPIAAYLAFKAPKGAIWFRLYLPFAVVGVLLTASRAALVVLGLVSLYPLLGLLRRAKRRKLGVIAAVLLSMVAVHYTTPSISFQRLATIVDEFERRDLNGRFAVWDNGMDLFWENPIIGVGGGAFSSAVRGGSQIAAHNAYLEVLVEHGTAGLLFFLAIILSLFVQVRRFPGDERMLWWIVLAALAVLITTLSWENREMTWMLWALCTSFVPPFVRGPDAA
jgi:O-antigen ligase